MPIFSKFVLTSGLLAACVIAIGSRTDADENPFARWEKTKQAQPIPLPPPATDTQPAESQAAEPQKQKAEDRATAVQFFSATKPTESATEVKQPPKAAKQTVRTERLKKVSQPNSDAPRSKSTSGVVLLNSPADSSSSNSGSGIVQAGFQSSSQGGSGIQQTAAKLPQDTNPFEELLGPANSSSSNETISVPSPRNQQTVTLPAPETTSNPFAEEFDSTSVVPRATATPQLSFDDTPFDTAQPNSSALAIPVRNVSSTESTLGRPTSSVVSSPTGPQTPRVSIRWQHDRDFNVGQQCACDLIVENTGVVAVQDVVAEASLATGLEVISAVPNPDRVGDRAEWEIGSLAPGQTRKISLVVVPRQQGDLQMNAFVRLTGSSASSLSVRQPALQVEVQGPKNLAIGELANFTVEVANPGSGEARNVVLQAIVPDGLQHRQGRRLTIDIGTLNSGESRRARLSLSGVQGGSQTIAVRVTGEGDLSDEGEAVVAVAEPKLNIGVRGPKESQAGQDSRFEIVVVNEGKVDSSNVRARYRLPEGYEFRSSDRGGKYNATERTIDWFVGTLEPNQIKHFEVTLRASRPGQFKHQVGVISELGKMTLAEQSTKVAGKAVLTLQVATNRRQVKSNGGETMFEVRLTNSGTSVAESVGLAFEVPPGLEIAEVTGPSKYISDSGVVMFRALPEIAPQDSVVFRISARCIKPGQHKARVRVASRSVSQPVIEEVEISGVE